MFANKPLCNAPFANIYIDGKGNVTPCCFNRDDILGNIFTNDLSQIWNSTTAIKIRELLANHKFPLGCIICEVNLKSNNYYNSGIFTYSTLNYKKTQIQSIDFELSYWCNLSCVMCYLHNKTYELSEIQEQQILEKLSPYLKSIRKTRFFGGEPLLIPIYRKIWQQIVEVNSSCNILVQTNGTIIDREIESLAKKGNFIFNISIDSLHIENSSKIRRGSNIEQILNNLKKFKELSKKDITLTITPMTLNWKEIPAIVKFANKNKLQIIFNKLIQPQNLSLDSLTTDELNAISRLYKKNIFIPYTIIQLINYIKFKNFINHIEFLKKERLKHPQYSPQELIRYSLVIYQQLAEKIPTLQQYEKTLILNKIQSLLKTKDIEFLLTFINNTPPEILENKVNEIINNE
ncbi:MAG: radical SAM protein [Bacteroidales bacterium]|nr:radical SAM protein [Bacteroidales bacterium]